MSRPVRLPRIFRLARSLEFSHRGQRLACTISRGTRKTYSPNPDRNWGAERLRTALPGVHRRVNTSAGFRRTDGSRQAVSITYWLFRSQLCTPMVNLDV